MSPKSGVATIESVVDHFRLQLLPATTAAIMGKPTADSLHWSTPSILQARVELHDFNDTVNLFRDSRYRMEIK